MSSANASYQEVEEGLALLPAPTASAGILPVFSKKSALFKIASLLVVSATLCIAYTAGASSVQQHAVADFAVADSLRGHVMSLDVMDSYGADAVDLDDEDDDGMCCTCLPVPHTVYACM